MDDVKLLPCPFCGGSAEFGRHEAYSTDSSFDCIRCAECDAMMEYEERRWDYEKKEWDYSSSAYAIAAWNTRTRAEGLREAARIARKTLLEIAGMDLLGASAVAWSAAREIDAILARAAEREGGSHE